jgi:CRP-like cAMP-binding protein
MSTTRERTGRRQLAIAEVIQRWPGGSVLLNEGDSPRGIYIIHTGQVDIVFTSRNGLRKVQRTARPGEILGLSEIVSGTVCQSTATTRTSSRIGFIGAEKLRRMLEEDPSLWLEVAADLSVDLGSCWQSMRRLNASR